MFVFGGVPLLVLLIAMGHISAFVVEKRPYDLKPWQSFEPLMANGVHEKNHVPASPKVLKDRSDDEIVTVTAKIWYVSDFHGKYTSATYAQVDENCVDDTVTPVWCERYIESDNQYETIPDDIINSWDEDTPHNRAQAVVDANLDYMNYALANSEVPIRYVQWGSVQDIGQTEAEIGSGYTGAGGAGATRSSGDVAESMRTVFGDSEEGRTRLYQSADVVLFLLNNGMNDASGVCFSSLNAAEGTQKEYRFAVFVAAYNNGWLFSHEAGHCIGAMHLKSSTYSGTRTNFAYCPPDGEYGTIEAYVWNCPNGPSGAARGKVPYWSNRHVEFEGVATGTEEEDNAEYMTEERFTSAEAGTNCLDGNPDDAWMNFESTGTIGNNCPNGEESYELPLSESLVDCEYADWDEWGECNAACGGGTRVRTREVVREAWYGGIKCTEEDATEEEPCNEDACPVCDDPTELSASTFTCESTVSYGSTCENTFDGDESTTWISGLNSPDYTDTLTWQDGGIIQWGYNTNVKIIFAAETIVSGVQIINKVDEADSYENYKDVKLAFSNGYEELVTLSSAGKQNDVVTVAQPVETSFVNVVGWNTFSNMGTDSWIGENGIWHTGFRSGISEIRIFGCTEEVDYVDGGWSEWGEWTECSATCGVGTYSRTRTCTAPEPSGTGAACEGDDTSTESCEVAACEGTVCFDVSLTTSYYGNEISWTLSDDCSSTAVFGNYETHEAECCLPPGEYTLECKDSYGDGWHGGYITINGMNYCGGFDTGSSETHEILIGEDTVPEVVDGEWITGHLCEGDFFETFFRGDLGKDKETAKADCAAGCHTWTNCMFASLFWTSNWQTCYLNGDGCGNYQDNEHHNYQIYLRPEEE